MAVTNINKKELYLKIESFRNILTSEGIKYPLDIFEICSKFEDLEIARCPFKTTGLRGMAVLADTTSNINCILVNSKLSYEEQNFHGVHELLHIYTSEPNSGQTFKCYDNVKPFQNSYIEWIANEGAAELTVPYKDLLPLVKKEYLEITKGLGTYEFCERTAPMFAVTSTVIQNRLNSLSYEIQQYIGGVPLENIKVLSKAQQHKENIFVKSLNDLETERLLNWFKPKNNSDTNLIYVTI